MSRERERRLCGDRGSSVVEFAMMSALLVLLLFGVLQVAAYFFVRSVVSSAAADGARHAAIAGATPDDGAARATEVIAKALSPRMAAHVPCTGSQTVDATSGLAVSQVRCSGQITSVFIPIGAFVQVDVTGQSLTERP